jgi:hypothetical protein
MMPTRRQLEQSRTRRIESAPDLTQVLRGSLFERRTRCGGLNCHCATGQGHPVTCVGVALPGGKNVQVTVPPELVPVVRQWTENYKKLWQMIEDVSSINRELLRGRLLDPTPPGIAAGKRAKHSSRKSA